MLPFLRIVPIGGVCLTALVLVLALEPPGKPPRAVSPDMALARGSLIDRTAHPEWPQMLVRAAYRRADEILKLRDLPNTPTLVAPVVLPPQRPAIVARPAPVVATLPPAPADQAATPSSPQPVTHAATLPANVDIAKPAAVTAPSPPVASAPAAATPHADSKISADSKIEAKAETAATAPAPTAAATAPAPTAAATAPAPRAATAPAPTAAVAAAPQATAMPATDAVPVPEPKPTKLAALPIERPASQPTSDDVTGAIADSSSATMPVDIGEASSTELPIVLPRERPVRLRVRRRGEERRRVEPHHRVKAKAKAKAKPKQKPRLPHNVQPASQVNLFDQLFDNSSAAKTQAAGPRTRGAKPPPTRQSTATNSPSPSTPYNQFDVR